MVKKSNKNDISLLSVPDRVTAEYVNRVLESECISHGDVVIGGQSHADVPMPSKKEDLSILLLVPHIKHGSKQISLARRFVESGGSVFAWSFEHGVGKASARDEWLLERLLMQAGAVTSPHLNAIALAVRMINHLGLRPPLRVQVQGRSNALVARMAEALKIRDVAAKKKITQPIIASVDSGGLTLSNGNQKLIVQDISVAARALNVLSTMNRADAPPGEPAVDMNYEEAYSIARPPARLLSETTSKRLISCFGLGLPNERLCKSAADASRFASSLQGSAVLKLVKPALEDKMRSGAVRLDVVGHAAVRRAVSSLELLGRSMGPPDALGYLVAEQIEKGDRIWLTMRDHAKFGRIVLLGPGDVQSDRPAAALIAPATVAQTVRALKIALPTLSKDSTDKLAVAVARFSRMAHKLKDRIDRAEINPLVALKKREQAIALDALVGVSGRQ
jgi:hypothetical protein